MRAFLCAAVILTPLAVYAVEGAAVPPSGLRGKDSPAQPEEHFSADKRFTWTKGAAYVSVFGGRRRRKISRVRLPPPEKNATRKVLFADRGNFFCVVDEIKEELGLHLDTKGGAHAAKTTVVRSGLTLMDGGGRILWQKRLRDQHVVGPAGTSPLRIAVNGTLAVLMQDADPFAKAHPLLHVYGPRGGTKLTLDYLDWKHIDEFALSDGGKYLAVRGYGRIAEYETWDTAVGFYHINKKKHWVQAMPEASKRKLLRTVDPDGRTCCVEVGEMLFAFGRDGDRAVLSAAEAMRKFGVGP